MKPSIPSPSSSQDARVLRPMKEILDVLTGARSGELEQLDASSTLPDAISKINEIIARLNRSGT